MAPHAGLTTSTASQSLRQAPIADPSFINEQVADLPQTAA
jgi:hypothetical protein